MRYRGSPKHKEPWQPGRRGSLCPAEIGAEQARRLLGNSILYKKKRYGVWEGRGYCAQSTLGQLDEWHGYPVGWSEVDPAVRKQFINEGRLTKRDVKRYWDV